MCGCMQGEEEWLKHLGSVKMSAELYVCVNDLLTKGVNWTKARQFFPNCDGKNGDFYSLSSIFNDFFPSFFFACTILGWWIRCSCKKSA
jgi:hypothetical protein